MIPEQGALMPVRRNAVFRNVTSKEVIVAIWRLHFPETTVADLTWGRGSFWTGALRSTVIARFDLRPRRGANGRADFRFVPLKTGAVDVAVLDPPHLHASGITTTLGLQDAFGSIPSQAEGHRLIFAAAPELRRVARLGAIIKVTDMVESGRYVPTHSIVSCGLKDVLGWPHDLAILDSGVVRSTRPNHRVLHLRHAHSFFLIYRWNAIMELEARL